MHQEGEFWDFFLADRLHCMPAQIRDLPARDYVGLVNWFEVKGVLTDLAVRSSG